MFGAGLLEIATFASEHPDEIILLDLTAGNALVQPAPVNVPIDAARIADLANITLTILGDFLFSSDDLNSTNPTIDELLAVGGGKNLLFLTLNPDLIAVDSRFIPSIFTDTFEPREDPEMLFNNRDAALRQTAVNNADDVVLVSLQQTPQLSSL